MKEKHFKNMKLLVLLTLMTGSASVGLSQTINAPKIPAEGLEFTFQTMASIASNVPVNGVWDFSKEVTATQSNFKLLPASASTSASIFSKATHVRQIGSTDESFVGYNGNESTYWGNPGSQFAPQRLYSTPVIMHVWPIKPNQAPYTHTGNGVFNIQTYTVYRTDKIDVTWISSGTLIMPDGKSYSNAVLLKVLRSYTDDNPVDPTKYKSSLDMYHWWVDGYAVPLVETRVFTPPTGQGNPQYSSNFRTPTALSNVKDKNQLAVSIYPNPTNGKFHINAPVGSWIKVSDVNAKEIKMIQAETSETAVDLIDFANGIYFIQVESVEGTAIEKIVKE